MHKHMQWLYVMLSPDVFALVECFVLNGLNYLHIGRWHHVFWLALYFGECRIIESWLREVKSKHQGSDKTTIPHVWNGQEYATNLFRTKQISFFSALFWEDGIYTSNLYTNFEINSTLDFNIKFLFSFNWSFSLIWCSENQMNILTGQRRPMNYGFQNF